MIAVWQGHGIKKEKRLIFFAAHPLQDILLNQVLCIRFAAIFCVLRELDALVIIKQMCREIRVRMALAVVAEKVIKALLERITTRIKHAHAPLADRRRGVALGFENFSHRNDLLRKRILPRALGDFPVAPHRSMSAMQARH